MLNFMAAPTVRNCILRGNSAGKGGAMYNMVTRSLPATGAEDAPMLVNVTFSGNQASGRGGAVANDLMTHLQMQLAGLPGTTLDGYTVDYADNFAYTDPVDGSISENQGIRIGFTDGSRIVYRLSGTGTEGATLRVYLEAFEPDLKKQHRETAAVMQPLVEIATGFAEIASRTGRKQPTVIT